jgi:hypothetical protein
MYSIPGEFKHGPELILSPVMDLPPNGSIATQGGCYEYKNVSYGYPY